MIRLVAFLVVILAAAAGLHWLADRPGTIVVEWQDHIVETSVFRAFIILVLAIAVVMGVWSAAARAVVEPGRSRPPAQPAPAGARARCALQRHDRHRRRRPLARHPLCRSGAQGAAERAAHASAAGADGAADRRPGDLAAHLRGHAVVAGYRDAGPARAVSRSPARRRAGGRAPVRRAGVEAQSEARLAGRGAVRPAVPGGGLAGRARHPRRRAAQQPGRQDGGRSPPRRAANRPGAGGGGYGRRQGARAGARGASAGARPGSCRGHRRPRAGRAGQYAAGSARAAQDLATVAASRPRRGLCLCPPRRQPARPAQPHAPSGAADAARPRGADRVRNHRHRGARVGRGARVRSSRCSRAA